MNCCDGRMKKIKFLSVILSLMLFFGSFAACNTRAYELNVMSFNIRTGGSGVQAWYNRKDAVIGLINNSGADVIGLQEVSSTPHSDFLVNLASNYEMVHFGLNEMLAIIYDKTVFNLVSSEKYWLTDTPDVRSLGWDDTNFRMAAVLMLKHIQTGEKIKVINTHGPLDDAGNVKAFNLIAERSLSDENDALTVMTGDFNAEPDCLGYASIAEKLQDCRVVATKSPNRTKNTFNGFGKNTTSILDYIFVSKSERVDVLNYQVREDKWGEGNYISDHYPVQVSVRVTLSEAKK